MTEEEAVATVQEFRRGLMQAHAMHSGPAERYVRISEPSDAEKIAFVGSVMAASYAYTIAAMLAAVRERHGLQAAAELTLFATRVLSDGDEEDTNADVVYEGGR